MTLFYKKWRISCILLSYSWVLMSVCACVRCPPVVFLLWILCFDWLCVQVARPYLSSGKTYLGVRRERSAVDLHCTVAFSTNTAQLILITLHVRIIQLLNICLSNHFNGNECRTGHESAAYDRRKGGFHAAEAGEVVWSRRRWGRIRVWRRQTPGESLHRPAEYGRPPGESEVRLNRMWFIISC